MTVTPASNITMRVMLNCPPSRPTSAAVMHSRPNAHRPWPATNSARGRAPRTIWVARLATRNAATAVITTSGEGRPATEVGCHGIQHGRRDGTRQPQHAVGSAQRRGARRARVGHRDHGDGGRDDQPDGRRMHDARGDEQWTVAPDHGHELADRERGEACQQDPSRPDDVAGGPADQVETRLDHDAQQEQVLEAPGAPGWPSACRACRVRRPWGRVLPRTRQRRPRGAPPVLPDQPTGRTRTSGSGWGAARCRSQSSETGLTGGSLTAAAYRSRAARRCFRSSCVRTRAA